MRVAVTNLRVYGNPYQRLLYSAIGDRYWAMRGTIGEAIAKQRALKKNGLFHVHWEESLFAKCASVADAVRVRREFIAALERYVAVGGKVIWTLHNLRAHEGRFVQTLVSLRKDLAALSHRILVHNQAGLSTVQAQTGLDDPSKVTVLPHPAYLDVYEPRARTQKLAGRAPAHPRTLLHFGMVRAYKGIPDLVRKLSPEFMAQHQLQLHICGQPHRADSFLDELLAQTQGRTDIQYSLDQVPDEEVADLLRAHAGVIIPYHHVLTSGVAVLSLTLGVPTVAPDTPAMRELYPASSHHLLFNPRSVKDMQRAALAVVEMSAQERLQIARDYIQQALTISPDVISEALGTIYDELLGREPSGAGGSDVVGQSDKKLHNKRPFFADEMRFQPNVSALYQLVSEESSMATRASKAASAELSNQQLALELVKATLVSAAARSSMSDELLLNKAKQNVNQFTVERARLDGAYAVRLYRNILTRLETPPAEPAAADAKAAPATGTAAAAAK